MNPLKKTITRALEGFHPSMFMSLFMLLVAGAMEVSHTIQSDIIATIMTASLSRMGAPLNITFTYVFIKYLLVIFAAIIHIRKPSPEGAFILSFPLIIYGWYALRYLSEAGLPDLSIPVLLAGGYAGVAMLIGALTLLADSQRERMECERDYKSIIEQLEKANAATGLSSAIPDRE